MNPSNLKRNIIEADSWTRIALDSYNYKLSKLYQFLEEYQTKDINVIQILENNPKQTFKFSDVISKNPFLEESYNENSMNQKPSSFHLQVKECKDEYPIKPIKFKKEYSNSAASVASLNIINKIARLIEFLFFFPFRSDQIIKSIQNVFKYYMYSVFTMFNNATLIESLIDTKNEANLNKSNLDDLIVQCHLI